MCWLVSPIFPNATNTLKQSLILINALLEKLKLNTLDCHGDFEDLPNTKEIIRLLINLAEIPRLLSNFSGQLYLTHVWKIHLADLSYYFH